LPERCDHRLADIEDNAQRGDSRGYDAGKKVKGTKRHLLVDTFGLVLAVTVLPASIQDRDGGLLLLANERDNWPRLRSVFADAGYA